MTAIFNFQSMLVVILLIITTCSYIRSLNPSILDKFRYEGFMGIFWKAARIGERLSPYISVFCIAMSVSVLFF